MTSTRSAAAAGLPVEPAHLHRRGFLRQLAALPLIGGGVTLIGQPTAVAEPVTMDLMNAYKTWLTYERRMLVREMAQTSEYVNYYRGRSQDAIVEATEGYCFFVGRSGQYHEWDGSSPAGNRAALVLSTVGCDWHDGETRT